MLGIRSGDPVDVLVTGPVATVAPSATLREASRALAASHLGLLVVVDHTGVRGVLSERDLVTAAADDLDLDLERVADHASDDVISVEHTTTIHAATMTMLEAEVRHLVIGKDGQLHGVVSVRDVAAALIEDDVVSA